MSRGFARSHRRSLHSPETASPPDRQSDGPSGCDSEKRRRQTHLVVYAERLSKKRRRIISVPYDFRQRAIAGRIGRTHRRLDAKVHMPWRGFFASWRETARTITRESLQAHTELCFLTATAMAGLIRAGELSAREVMEAHLQHSYRAISHSRSVYKDNVWSGISLVSSPSASKGRLWAKGSRA